MDKEEKLRKLRKWLEEHGLTQQDVADRLGISAPYVNALLTGKREFGKKMAAKWYNHFGLLPPYLMLGEGPMTDADERQPADPVSCNPYFDNDTIQGGFGSGTGMEQFNRNEAAGYMRVPGVRVSPDIPFIKVKGDSMLDRDNPQRSIPEGSYVALDRVTTTIQWGEVYAVMTDDGPIVKRLYPSDNDGCIRCVSFNSEYPPFELETVKIRGDIYRVIARVIINRY